MRKLFKFLKAAFTGANHQPTVRNDRFIPQLGGVDPDDIAINLGDTREGQRASPRNLSPALQDFHRSLERVASSARGVALGICYGDANGTETMRRIRVNEIYKSYGQMYISAHCYERNAPRTFRLDRIEFVFDLDGEIFEPRAYFNALLELNEPPPEPAAQPQAKAAAKTSPPRTYKPGEQIRKLTRPFILVMTAIARSDGELHPAEVETIVNTCCEFAADEGISNTEEDRAALVKYIKRQYPNRETVEDMMDKIEDTSSQDRFDEFMQALEDLIHADGTVDEAEEALFEELTGEEF